MIPITLEWILKKVQKGYSASPIISVTCVLCVYPLIHHSLFIFAQEYALAIKKEKNNNDQKGIPK